MLKYELKQNFLLEMCGNFGHTAVGYPIVIVFMHIHNMIDTIDWVCNQGVQHPRPLPYMQLGPRGLW